MTLQAVFIITWHVSHLLYSYWLVILWHGKQQDWQCQNLITWQPFVLIYWHCYNLKILTLLKPHDIWQPFVQVMLTWQPFYKPLSLTVFCCNFGDITALNSVQIILSWYSSSYPLFIYLKWSSLFSSHQNDTLIVLILSHPADMTVHLFLSILILLT